jgi:drug/metabolite transporter (DMT)-like permease
MFSPFSARARAEAVLVAVTFFWGLTFPVVKDAVALIPAFSFLAIRFFIAAALMLPFLLPRGRRLPPQKSLGGRGICAGLILGVLLFAGFGLQTVALTATSASNSAFLTGLNVVWVALLAGPLVGKKPGRRAKIAIAVSLVGLFLLTWPDGGGGFNQGDALAVACSIFFALHIIGLDKWGGAYPSMPLTFIQIAAVAALSAMCNSLWEPSLIPPQLDAPVIFALALTATAATVFAYWAQTHYQHRTTPTRVGLIFILEPAFAAVVSALFYGERIGIIGAIGALIMTAAMIEAVLEKPTTAKGG